VIISRLLIVLYNSLSEKVTLVHPAEPSGRIDQSDLIGRVTLIYYLISLSAAGVGVQNTFVTHAHTKQKKLNKLCLICE
jgi:hypothetical protein